MGRETRQKGESQHDAVVDRPNFDSTVTLGSRRDMESGRLFRASGLQQNGLVYVCVCNQTDCTLEQSASTRGQGERARAPLKNICKWTRAARRKKQTRHTRRGWKRERFILPMEYSLSVTVEPFTPDSQTLPVHQVRCVFPCCSAFERLSFRVKRHKSSSSATWQAATGHASAYAGVTPPVLALRFADDPHLASFRHLEDCTVLWLGPQHAFGHVEFNFASTSNGRLASVWHRISARDIAYWLRLHHQNQKRVAKWLRRSGRIPETVGAVILAYAQVPAFQKRRALNPLACCQACTID